MVKQTHSNKDRTKDRQTEGRQRRRVKDGQKKRKKEESRKEKERKEKERKGKERKGKKRKEEKRKEEKRQGKKRSKLRSKLRSKGVRRQEKEEERRDWKGKEENEFISFPRFRLPAVCYTRLIALVSWTKISSESKHDTIFSLSTRPANRLIQLHITPINLSKSTCILFKSFAAPSARRI